MYLLTVQTPNYCTCGGLFFSFFLRGLWLVLINVDCLGNDVKSYVLGEIPSLKDRITIVRQLWDLTRDVLVLVEPGTPQGSNIISQMCSPILWMERRLSSKCRKSKDVNKETSKDLVTCRSGCPHDGACPLEKSGKYCHFIQCIQRTTSQRAYKVHYGLTFHNICIQDFMNLTCFSLLLWIKIRVPSLSLVYVDVLLSVVDDPVKAQAEAKAELMPYEEKGLVCYDSDAIENDDDDDSDKDLVEKEEETNCADLSGGWGRIIFPPV
ncbi:hypothetical protein Dsin_024629 [Dipteronia sinensis]|uniref:Uncharacterized protein n=1 Tax=Dipteronia sinensis TaxID=43782 RepID=A0AAD9ZVG0_9ROSI|nr:hypothetical protein Dsin_024629 [Dipteronia sinensis]